jgi:hypothetical protein
VFAPLALVAGAFTLLFSGVRLLLSNWRLALVQFLPAMWIWLAMVDLKAHFFEGQSFHSVSGLVLIPLIGAVIAITVACFYLNAVFGFAIAQPDAPRIRPAFAQASRHRTTIVAWGVVIGSLLAVSTLVLVQVTGSWFVVVLGIVVGGMMVSYVAVPARLIGAQRVQSRRDKVATTALGGVLSAIVCTPPYLLGRVGVLMLGSKALLVPGIIVLVLGFTLELATTAAVRVIKMSAKLVSPEQRSTQPR